MQPTARSTSCSSSAISTEPAEWERSQSASAPARWAIAVIAGRSATCPELVGDVAEQHQRRPVPRRPRRDLLGRRPCRRGSGVIQRSSRSRSAATPSTTNRSVGKLSVSATISRPVRPRRRPPPAPACRAAPSWSRRPRSGPEPHRGTTRAIVSPSSVGAAIQSSSQARISRSPHGPSTNAASRSRGGAQRTAERVAVEVGEHAVRRDEGGTVRRPAGRRHRAPPPGRPSSSAVTACRSRSAP